MSRMIRTFDLFFPYYLKRSSIRWLLALGVFSVFSLISIQVYWVKRAFDLQEAKFKQSVMIALRNVADQVSRAYGLGEMENPVSQLSSDYYVVNLRLPLNEDILASVIRESLAKQELHTDFEFGIYDCDTDRIVYGAYVSWENETNAKPSRVLPKSDQFLNYFGIRFPQRSTYLLGSMNFWVISTLITLIVVIFFFYAMWMVLQQRRLSEIQKDFVNNMTHEFQTPISTIQIASDILSQDRIREQPERFHKYVAIIQQENKRLKRQVETLLTTAKIEQGKFVIHKELCDVHALLDEVLTTKLLDTQFELITSFEAIHPTIWADREHLVNVFRNLIDNACKYALDTPHITISTYHQEKNLIVSFQDKGIGIPPEYLPRIFDRFFRVPTGNIHNVKGFGLGLNYVQTVVKSHGWRIKVVSQPNQGTEFILTISQE